jgi:hypothetical protein
LVRQCADAAAPVQAATAEWFASSDLYGYGATWLLMNARLRVGLHKFAKEGLLCLLESCTKDELEQARASVRPSIHMPV